MHTGEIINENVVLSHHNFLDGKLSYIILLGGGNVMQTMKKLPDISEHPHLDGANVRYPLITK